MNKPEFFWDIFENTARDIYNGKNEQLSELDKVTNIIKENETFALYPCGRYSRQIINHLEQNSPDLLTRLVGVFDKSNNVNFRDDVPLFHLDDINPENFSILILAASKFPSDLHQDIELTNVPQKKIVTTSLFQEELSHIPYDTFITKIKTVINSFSDNKSRISYLLTWLAILLQDKSILAIYSSPSDFKYHENGIFPYHGLRLHNIDECAIQAALYLGMYSMEHVFPEKQDIVFDVGAYRGDTAAFFHHHLGETGKIYAFEPDSINFQHLKENIATNKIHNVIPVNKALLDETKSCNLVSLPQSGSFLYVMPEQLDTDDFSKIEATSVDSFMEENKIPHLDFIKSDIEGSEIALIKGARQSIINHTPKMALAIYHSLHDLIEIPLLLKEINPGYSLYLRHWNFADSPWEILLYAKQEA